MSFFSSLAGFFKKIFGKDGETVQTVLADINVLYQDALPIVAALGAAVSMQDMVNPSAATKKIQAVLDVYIKDSAMVDQFIVKNSGLSIQSILANAAVLVLSYSSGITVVKDLQLAVQLAYAVYSAYHPTTTGKATVAMLGKS
jgi:hypothetical protein